MLRRTNGCCIAGDGNLLRSVSCPIGAVESQVVHRIPSPCLGRVSGRIMLQEWWRAAGLGLYCTGTMLAMYRCCIGAARMQQWYCVGTLLSLHCYCGGPVLMLHQVWRLHWHCPCVALLLHCSCSCCCTGTALLVHRRFPGIDPVTTIIASDRGRCHLPKSAEPSKQVAAQQYRASHTQTYTHRILGSGCV